MIEYKYKKREKKFTENGHAMFEADVLQRLKRLADLEEQIKQCKLLLMYFVNNNKGRVAVNCRNCINYGKAKKVAKYCSKCTNFSEYKAID